MKKQKIKPQKTYDERKQEVGKLINQFLELGISLEHTSTQQIIKIAKDFENHGWSANGTLKFPEYDRKMIYLFSSQPHIQSYINLHYTGHKK